MRSPSLSSLLLLCTVLLSSTAAIQVSGMTPKTLVTFDIDGTICRQKSKDSALHSRAFSHAFQAVFGIDASINEIQHHGSTDQLILVKVLMHRGVRKAEAEAKLPELMNAMLLFAEENKHTCGDGLELLPGVKETLTQLRDRGDVITGLVTGNLQPIAWMKMEALGLTDCFTAPRFGGFGSDHCSGEVDASHKDRAEFIRIARARAVLLHGIRDEDIVQQFHVGDAETDVEAAELGGASAIGVATGIFSADQLRAKCRSQHSIVLPSMASFPDMVKALRLDAQSKSSVPV